ILFLFLLHCFLIWRHLMGTHALLKIFGAMALAVLAGLFTGTSMGIDGVTFYQIYDLIGRLFLNALTLVVVPLVTSSIIAGTARIGTEGAFGVLGAKTLITYLLTNLFAILIGWAIANILTPGLSEGLAPPQNISPTFLAEITEKAPETGFG